MTAALVTGGAKRIGREISIALASRGFDVGVNYNSTEPEDVLRDIAEMGVQAKAFKADLNNFNETENLIRAVKEEFSDLSLLINNASIFEEYDIERTTEKIFDRHFNINFKAPFFLSKAFFRMCRKGQVINILDRKIMSNESDHAAYLLSKKMLAGFTKMAAKEFAPDIRVNAIAPGLILPPAGKGRRYLEKKASGIPLKRAGSPRDIITSLNFLLEAEFITGQIIYVDGGERL